MGILKDLETYILPAEKLADEGIPSVSIAWLDHPSSSTQSHTIARGSENTETVYQACSISKAIAALAIARLIDQEKLSYETNVAKYIPGSILESIGSEHLMAHVTVGRLVSHTAGLSQHSFPGYAGDTLPTYEEIFAGRPPANTPRVRFSSFPGTEMSYSSAGYLLLQVFLEKFTGMEFADLMRQTVLEPLGMTRSVYGAPPPEEWNYARAHHNAYTPGGAPPDITGRGYHRFTELAASGLWTTPTDLLKATSAIQTSLYPNPPGSPAPFLSQRTAREMLTLTTPTSSSPTRKQAMGWFLDTTFFAHANSNAPAGYTCYLLAGHTHSDTTSQTGFGTNGIAGYYISRSPSLSSLAIMTNSSLGFPIIKKLISALFVMKSFALYPNLPCGIDNMTDYVPFPAPDGIMQMPGWEAWTGQWEEGWEIYDDEGLPMVAWDGVEVPHRLLQTATPVEVVDGVRGFCFKIEGVEMGIRLVPGTTERYIEIIGSEVRVLRKAYMIEAPPRR